MNIQGFKNMAESLRLYHRITNEKYTDCTEEGKFNNLLEKVYTDILPNNGILQKVLERNTTFVVGQRGTGKSTIIAMAQNEIAKKKKDLSIYINAKNIYKSCQMDSLSIVGQGDNSLTQEELFRIQFIKKAIIELCQSMMSELKSEKQNILAIITGNQKIRLVEELIQEIQDLLDSEEFKRIDKIISKSENFENKAKVIGELKGSLTNLEADLGGSSERGISGSSQFVLARQLNFSNIIKKFLDVLDICHRKGMYVFIDDYSELDISERAVFMNELIAPLYHLGVDKVFLKIACYPNKLNPITLDTQKYSIVSIDFFDIYGIDNSISATEKQAKDYVERLMKNSCGVFCGCKPSEYFDTTNTSMDEYYMTLHRICMNVPRVLGHILNTCYMKRINNDKLINLSALNEASIKYYHEHIKQEMDNKLKSTDVDKEAKVNIYVQQKLIKSVIELAKENKTELTKTNNSYFNKFSEVPTSHFRTDEENDIYFENLMFYGYVHKVNKIADKGKKVENRNINTSVYVIDYGICMDEKILYGKPNECDTKYYQQRAFLYDECILKVLKDNKKLVCNNPLCGAEYPIEKLEIFREFGMRCQRCQPGICEIKYNDILLQNAEITYSKAIWSEQEMDIIYALYRMKSDENIMFFANEISGEIDLSSNIIAARCKELARASYIVRDEQSSPYKYGLTNRSEEIIKNYE